MTSAYLHALCERLRRRPEFGPSPDRSAADNVAMITAHVTSSYVHVQRALDLLRYDRPLVTPTNPIDRGQFFSRLADDIVQWFTQNNIRTLGQLIISNDVRVGSVFSHTGPFYGKGVIAYQQGRRKELPELYAKLDELSPGQRLSAIINPEHLTTVSASDHVSGYRRLFFAGIVDAVSATVIRARPVLIGVLVDGIFARGANLGLPRFQWTGEVFLSNIDQFAAAATAPTPSAADLKRLATIPEVDVKHAFAEIIGEPFVPRDRPDEMSDLITTNISVEGERVSAAIAFKGPAKFRPLTVADMGKNGDQIYRLFNEPADLVIVQHCHQITSPIRSHMRAFATQPGHGRMFCLINGADTVRILRTFKKLGFKSRRAG